MPLGPEQGGACTQQVWPFLGATLQRFLELKTHRNALQNRTITEQWIFYFYFSKFSRFSNMDFLYSR